jgi:hypothetical protein
MDGEGIAKVVLVMDLKESLSLLLLILLISLGGFSMYLGNGLK